MKSMRLVLPSVVLALFIVVGSVSQAGSSQDLVVSSPTFANSPELVDNQDVQELKTKMEGALHRLQSDAAFSIDDFKIQAEKNEALLKKRALAEAKKLQEKAARDSELLVQQAQEQVVKINEETAKKVLQAEQKRAEDMLTVVFNAEQEALKIKFQERKKQLLTGQQGQVINFLANDLPGRLSTRIPVTESWRTSIFNSFDRDAHFIQNIIVEAEAPEQARDFVNKFNEQSMWFDSTLRGTHYFHDPYYEQVVRKKAVINKLATAQEKADEIIGRFGKKIALSDTEQQKLRLFVLYDLNGVVNKYDTSNPDQIIPLDETTLRGVVARVADEVLGAQLKERGLISNYVMNDIEPVDRQIFDNLKKEMGEIKSILDEEIVKYNALKEQRKNIDQEKTQEALALEVQLKESQVLITHYKEQLKRAQLEQINATIKCNDLVRQIEARAKDSLDFEVKLNKAEKQIADNKNAMSSMGRAMLHHFKPDLEAGIRQALEIETDLKSSQQTVKHLKQELDVTLKEVSDQKDVIVKQNKLYRELSTRGKVLEELAEQRFNEQEQKMIAEQKNLNMK